MRFAARNDLEPSSWKMGINFIVETSLAIARWMSRDGYKPNQWRISLHLDVPLTLTLFKHFSRTKVVGRDLLQSF